MIKNLIRLCRYYWIQLIAIFIFTIGITTFMAWYFQPQKAQAAGWYDESLLYRTPVTVDNTGSADSNKRILVDVNTSALISAGKMQSDCGDTRFTDIHGNILQYYIDTAGGACNTSGTDYWVLLPEAISAEPLTIYHYYGNDLMINGTQTAQFAQSALAGYTATIGTEETTQQPVAFWKFDEGTDNTCPGGTNDVCDHTTARHDLINSGATWQTPDLCKNGQCLKFDGTNDFLSMADDEELDFDATSSFTLSGWFKRGPISAGTEVIMNKIAVSTTSLGSTATNTITTSSDEGLGGMDMSWNKRVIYDSNNDRWHVLYIDGSSDIVERSSASSSGVTFDGSGTIVAGTYDYDDFDCVSELDGSTTYMHCTYSDGADQFLYYKRCALTGSAPYISCDAQQTVWNAGTQGAAPDATDDIAIPHIATDVNDCALIFANYIDQSETGTTNDWENWLWKEGSTCGDGTWSDESAFPKTDFAAEGGYSSGFANGIYAFEDGTDDAQLFYVDNDSATSADIQSIYFDGTGFGTQRDLNLDFEWDGSYANISSILVGGTAVSIASVDGVRNLTNFPILTKNGSSSTSVGVGLSSPTATNFTGQTIFSVIDSNAAGGNDVWVFAADNADPSDIYYNKSTDGGASWGTRTLWVNSFDTSEVKFLSAQYNSENCDIMVTWLGNASTPWNVNTKIVNTGSCSSGTGTKGYSLRMESDGDLTFSNTDGANGDSVTSTAATYDDNVWHHFSAVRNGSSSLTLYIDGIAVASDTSISSTATLANSGSLYLGIDYNGASNPYKGFLDETKIYRYARTATQVKTDAINSAGPPGSSASFNKTTDPLQRGLVGYWKLDETAANSCTGGTNDSCDSSGNHNDGAWSGNATTAQGQFGNGVTFDGSGDYISVSESPVWDFDTNSSYTVAFWFKTSATADNGNYLTKGLGSAYPFKFEAVSSNRIQFAISDGTNTPGVTSTNSVEDNTWHHVIGIRDVTSDQISMYLDGILVNSTTDTTTSSIANNLNLFFATRNAGTSNFFTGSLDDVRIYNRAISPSEIDTLYRWAGFQTGYWNFDEGRNQSLYNRGTVGQTASMTNGPVWTTGKIGKAIAFDGTNDYVTTSTAANNFITAGESTITAWVLPAGTAPVVSASYDGSRIVGDVGTDQSCNGCFFGIYRANISGSDQIWAYNWDGAEDRIGMTYTVDEWVHIAWVHSAGNLLLYKNGVLSGTVPSTDTTNLTNSLVFGGGVDSSKTFNGKIDEVKTYNYARTAGQIIEDMNTGHPIGGSPIGSQTAYWKFDDGYGTTAQDTSINNNDATLTNMAAPSTSISGWNNSGKIGKAIAFDGTNDYISATSNINPSATDFTISFWLYPKSLDLDAGADRIILAQQDGSGTGRSWLYIDGADGHIKSFLGNTAKDSEYTLTTNTWVHIALAHQNTNNTFSWYINGQLIKTNTNVNPESATGNYIIGDHKTLGNGNYYGLIDELKMYQVKLTSEQILIDYNRGKAANFGYTSTASDGTTADNSSAREYCIPGDTSTCNAPVAEWKLDEGSGQTTNDTSGNNNTSSTFTNEVAWRPGKFGSGLYFDGTDDVVRFAETSSTDIGGTSDSYTISAWFKTGVINALATSAITAKYSGSGTAYPFWLYIDTFGRPGVAASDGTNTSGLFASTSYANNAWHYIAMVRNVSTDRIYFYLDGAFVSSTTDNTTGSIANNIDVSIGNAGVGYTGADTSGLVDNVRIYNYPRTEAQIAWEYNKGAPIAWYKFDECQGVTAFNSAKNGNDNPVESHGTWSGSTGPNTAVGTCTSGTSTEARSNGGIGKINSSLDFDGTDDEVNIGESFNDLTVPFSVSAWVNLSSAKWNPIFSTDYLASGTAYQGAWLIVSNTNTFQISYGDNTAYGPTGRRSKTSTDTLSTGVWQHIVGVVRGATDMSLYINGNQVNGIYDGSGGSMVHVSSGSPAKIGVQSSLWADAKIDDVRLFNYGLTDAQVKTIYNNGAVSFQ